MGLRDIVDLQAVLLFVLPGAIFLYSRNIFLSSPSDIATKDGIGPLILASLFYVLIFWMLYGNPSDHIKALNSASARAVASAIFVIPPFLIGILYGYAEREEWLAKFIRHMFKFLGLEPPVLARSFPSAWWEIFSELATDKDFVSVTLKSGEKIQGVLGQYHTVSLSEDGKPLDLFIETVYEDDPDGDGYKPCQPVRGVWIPADEIKLVHFFFEKSLGEELDATPPN